MDRRAFLAAASAGALAAALPSCSTTPAARTPRTPAGRVVLVRFGGGVRHRDVFGTAAECLAPGLRAAARNGVLFDHVRASNLTVHDANTAYLLTGRYGGSRASNAEREANLAELRHAPTLFECFRASGNRDLETALAVGVPPHFDAPRGGRAYGALCFASPASCPEATSPTGDPSLGALPERVLINQRIGQLTRDLGPDFHSRLQDLDRPLVLAKARERLTLDPIEQPVLQDLVAEFLTERILQRRPWIGIDEADDLTVELATRAMRAHRPTLAVLAMATPDVAHFGAWRNYAAQVRRIDEALGRLRKFLDTDPFYKGRTLLLITPDCGRGDPAFDGHTEPFDAESHRRVFAVALGAGVDAGRVVPDAREQIDVAATIAAALEFKLPDAEGAPWTEVLA